MWLAFVSLSYNTFYLPTDIKDNFELSERLKDFEADLRLPANVPFTLQHFSYNNTGVLELVYGHLNRTNFSGITVSIYYNLHGTNVCCLFNNLKSVASLVKFIARTKICVIFGA